MQRLPLRAAGLLLITLVLGACAATAGPTPATSPAASPPPAGPLTADEAAALVLVADARFAGIGPQDPNLIGQDRWYEVGPGTTGFTVTVTIGWGDCPAGCINRHVWRYEVAPDRTVRLVEETGEALPDAVRAPVAGDPGVAGRALAGPVCPVVSDPPDPACSDRPVPGAEVVVRDAGGAEVARATTAADGTYAIALSPGDYSVVALPVEGLMGTPEAQPVTVPADLETPVQVDLVYDTGIR
ncbi:MAG: carboxypeptidase-like regulatory domain-containing protein [Chloroflexi bacterium]|nr:carboxypeptidase-like regulatory domain-containing protein [Chloroflexota bacterium]